VTPLALAACLSISSAAELNPAAVIYKLPDQIPWSPVNALGGAKRRRVAIRPSPASMRSTPNGQRAIISSRPHFHPNDRYIVVLQGT